ncbi:hypothetical protein AVEN_178578-1 [Araneus ventricosus]|uniref:Uncharacterized protein n=1 Tax=Araneus ventricosus TaxID=182803 RepID=A0A4Y2FJB6_ARAVE|nr:hypothetical protein AVEN_178578-1 [Araneus ventricosus]
MHIKRHYTVSRLTPCPVHIIIAGVYSCGHFHAHCCCHGYVHRGTSRSRDCIHAGQPPEDHLEPMAIFLVHPAVNGGVVTGVAHGQPVTCKPQVDDIGVTRPSSHYLKDLTCSVNDFVTCVSIGRHSSQWHSAFIIVSWILGSLPNLIQERLGGGVQQPPRHRIHKSNKHDPPKQIPYLNGIYPFSFQNCKE